MKDWSNLSNEENQEILNLLKEKLITDGAEDGFKYSEVDIMEKLDIDYLELKYVKFINEIRLDMFDVINLKSIKGEK